MAQAKTTPTALPRRTFCLETWKEARDPTNANYQSWTQFNNRMVARSHYLLDDMTFDDNGMSAANGPPEHAGKYSYAYLIRRDTNVERTTIHLTVVVYLQRSMDTLSDESAYYATPDQNVASGQVSNKVTLHYDPSAQSRPALRRGSWIMDATMYDEDPATGNPIAVPQGYFYRISEAGEPYSSGSEMLVDVYLDSNLRATVDNRVKSRTIVVPEGVLEVYDKGLIEMSSPSRVN